MVGMTAFADDDLDDTSTVARSSRATRRCCGPRPSPASSPSTRPAGHGATILAAHMAEPTGYGRLVRNKHGLVARVVEEARRHPGGAGHPGGQHLHLLLPARPARPCPAPGLPRQRPGRVLPDRRDRRPPRHRPRGRRLHDRRRRAGAGRQRPLAAGAGRARAARAASTGRGCSTGVTMLDPAPDLHRRHRRARAATSPCTPARSCRAPRWSATAARSARTPASWTAVVGDGAVVEHAVVRESRVGAALARRSLRRARTGHRRSGPTP